MNKNLIRTLVSSVILLGASSALATNILYRHLDALDVDYVGGVMTLDIRTYTGMSPGVPINNDDYTPVGNPIIVPITNTYAVPNTANWDCLGRNTTIYRLLQTDTSATKPWVGLNTQDVASGVFVGNKIQLQLVSVVSAPVGAHMAYYTTDGAGVPTSRLNTRTTGSCNKMFYEEAVGVPGISVGAHVHGFWGFTHPGTYVLRFKASGTVSAGGAVVNSGNVDYTFKVQ
jgi:surface-anchored protein